MKRAMAMVVLLGLATQAHADNRDAWQATFAGSVTVGLAGAIMYVHGANKMHAAEDELCDGGAYFGCLGHGEMLTQADVDRLNAKGDRGERIANLGAATIGVATVIAGIAFYKGFVRPRREKSVVVAPTVSREGAGAALQLRW